MSRILAIDYGTRRTGLAISDPTRTIAQALGTVSHRCEAELIGAISRIIAEWQVSELVVGLPLGSRGQPSQRSQAVQGFCRRLAAATRLPVHTINERFSTVRASQVLATVYGGTSRKPRRQQAVDRVAATIILEDYLATLG